MMQKKILSLCLVALLLLQLIIGVIPISAATTSTAFLVTSSTTAEPGDVVSLTVSLTSNPGLTYLKLKVSYDATALTLFGVQNGKIISDLTRGSAYVWSTAKTTTTTGTLATLIFTVNESAKAGNYPITITCVEASNHENDVTLSIQKGNITVTPKECMHQMEVVSYKESTCTQQGAQVFKCQKCGHSETLTIAIVDCVAENEADCENNAVCQYCGKPLEKAFGHKYRIQVIAPTTETEGYTVYTCMRCGDSYEDDFLPPIQDHTHTYTLEETVAPTCIKKGYSIYKCSDVKCGATEIRNEKAELGHNYSSTIIAPTCQTIGYTQYICRACDDNYQDNFVTNKEAHNYVGGKCTYCGATRTDTVPVTGITLSETNVTMKIGDGKWIEATVLPGDATNQLVNWTSSDESIVDVASSGDNNQRALLVAISNGTATITATTADGGFVARCVVNVGDNPHIHSYSSWENISNSHHRRECSCGHYELTEHRWDGGIMIGMNIRYTCMDCIAFYTASPVPGGSATLTVSSHETLPGETIQVTVSLKNNPGIASAILNVSFDTSILTLQAVEYNTAMGGQTVPPQSMNSPVTLYWVSPFADMSEDCVFATLTFKVSENAKEGDRSNIAVTYEAENVYNLAEENVTLDIVPGEITIIDYVPGDINGDGILNNKDVTRLMQYFAGWNVTVNTPALDVNNDGSTNNKDVTRLMQYLAGWNVEIH